MKKKTCFLRYLSLCLAGLLLAGGLTSPVQAKKTCGWEIKVPHPAEVFGEPDEITYDKKAEDLQYHFAVGKDPKEKMDRLADRLEEFGLTAATSKKSFSGDRTITLKKDRKELARIFWDKSEKLLTVSYDALLYAERKEDGKTSYYCVSEDRPDAYFEEETAAKQKNYGISHHETVNHSNGDVSLLLGKNEEVRYDWHEENSLIVITYKSGWTKAGEVPAETKPQTSQTNQTSQTGQTAASQKVDPYSVYLPDLATYLETKYTQDVWGYTHYVTCLVSKSDEADVVAALKELLLEPRYQLKERETWSGTESGKSCDYYSFEYTGKSSEVDWIKTTSGRKYYVRLAVMDYSNSQTAIVFSSHPEFILKDPGVTWKDQGGGTKKPTDPATTVTTTGGATELPSFLQTKGGAFNIRQYDPPTSAKHSTGIIFGADVDEADAAEKYVNMLVKDYGYKIINTREKKHKDYYNFTWDLAHPDKAVGRAHPLKTDGGDGDVSIKIICYYDSGDCSLQMGYVTDLTFPDADGQKPEIKEGETECTTCNRGKCRTCGGLGKVKNPLIGTGKYVTQDCTAIFCNGGSCTVCGGDGVI